MSYSRKIDERQPEIVAALRRLGCAVLDLSQLGKGCPDILVSYRNILYLMEIKSKKGKLNPLQAKWHSEWRGKPVCIVRSVDQALMAVGISDAKLTR